MEMGSEELMPFPMAGRGESLALMGALPECSRYASSSHRCPKNLLTENVLCSLKVASQADSCRLARLPTPTLGI